MSPPETRWRTRYSTLTGETMGAHSGEGPLERTLREGEGLIEGRWHPGFYVDIKTLAPHPLERFAPEISPNRIASIPSGTEIWRQGARIAIAKRRVARLGTAFEEVLTVELRHPRCQRMIVTVPCEAGGTGETIPQDYAVLRRAAYPPLTDLADALVKADPASPFHDGGAALEKYKAACVAVKQAIPKPA